MLITIKNSFYHQPDPGMLIRFTKKRRLNLGNLLSLGGKDSDMQASSKAGVGVRCHYLTNGYEGGLSSAVTPKIHSLREGILLLSESVAT